MGKARRAGRRRARPRTMPSPLTPCRMTRTARPESSSLLLIPVMIRSVCSAVFSVVCGTKFSSLMSSCVSALHGDRVHTSLAAVRRAESRASAPRGPSPDSLPRWASWEHALTRTGQQCGARSSRRGGLLHSPSWSLRAARPWGTCCPLAPRPPGRPCSARNPWSCRERLAKEEVACEDNLAHASMVCAARAAARGVARRALCAAIFHTPPSPRCLSCRIFAG